MTNDCAQYGLSHFLFRYGIQAKINQGKETNIEIRCEGGKDDKSSAAILIQTLPNEIQQDIMGYLTIEDRSVPLFETPRLLSIGGDVIATFRNGGTSYPCVIMAGDTLTLGFDLFNEIGHMLSGRLDAVFDEPDGETMTLMKTPVVDILEEFLFRSLKSICQINDVELQNKPFWPGGKRFAVCLSHDVDRAYKTYQYIPSILNNIKKGKLYGMLQQVKSMLFYHGKHNPYWTFDKITALEDEIGVKSTFYFLNESGRLNPLVPRSWILFTGRYKINDSKIVETIKRLNHNGFELGVHGSYYSYKDMSLLKMEKENLEAIIGSTIHGIRQHYLNYDSATPKIQSTAGFVHDSSVGFRKGIGFRRGTCFPYHPFDFDSGKELAILEIPLIIMDGSAFPNEAGVDQCTEIMNIVEKSNGVLTLLWHQNSFSEVDFPSMTELYRQLVEKACEKGAWITTARELYRWLIYER